jgi:hypothetical protein
MSFGAILTSSVLLCSDIKVSSFRQALVISAEIYTPFQCSSISFLFPLHPTFLLSCSHPKYDPHHVRNTLLVTYPTYLFLSRIIYGYIYSSYFSVNPAVVGQMGLSVSIVRTPQDAAPAEVRQ